MLIVLLMLLFLIAAVAIFGTATRSARIHHARAIQSWTNFLPALALTYYAIGLLLTIFKNQYDLQKLGLVILPFKPLESCVLLTVALVYLTRHANLMALISVLYVASHSVTNGYRLDQPGPLLFLIALMVLFFLGDKAPWSATSHSGSHFGTICRKAGVGLLCFASLLAIILALFKIVEMKDWLDLVLKIRLSRFLVASLLFGMLAGWISVGIKSLRPFMMPLLAIPTIMVMAAMTGMHSSLSALLFVTMLAVSWSTSERRSLIARPFDAPISRRLF